MENTTQRLHHRIKAQLPNEATPSVVDRRRGSVKRQIGPIRNPDHENPDHDWVGSGISIWGINY